MGKEKWPFVSIVTPVYNGETYLAECIESVLKQTYANWEYIIVNNCSTDDTLAIAEHYAEKNERIEVVTNETFLKQIPNWNEAMRQISSNSTYCKVVHADDALMPKCLEKMVKRGQEYPTAGVISSYRFIGDEIQRIGGGGLPYSVKFMPGKKAGKKVITTSVFLFGSPTTVLYRADLVRKKRSFYDPTVVHADSDVCFKILTHTDFAFVHELLSFTREHGESTSTFCDYYHTYCLFDLYVILNYGKYYLTSEEYDKWLNKAVVNQHQWLAKLMLNRNWGQMWQYHKNRLARMGMEINWPYLMKAFTLEAAKVKPIVKLMLQKYDFCKSRKLRQQKDIIETKKVSTTNR